MKKYYSLVSLCVSVCFMFQIFFLRVTYLVANICGYGIYFIYAGFNISKLCCISSCLRYCFAWLSVRYINLSFPSVVLIICFCWGTFFIPNTAKADTRYFLDYSLAGGGFSPTSNASYYADLDLKGGIFLSKNFQIGAGLGIIYYDSKVLDEFKVNDGGFKGFLTMQYNITDRFFAFTNVGIASLKDNDLVTNSYDNVIQNPDGTGCKISVNQDCYSHTVETKDLDFKSLGYAEIGFGFLMTQSVYFAISYKVFSQSIEEHYESYYTENRGEDNPITVTNPPVTKEENRLDQTISFKIGIYISDFYNYSAEY
ncbi:hypothetical protein HAV_00509 [Candidatus Hepatincola sp. Av]